MPCALGAGPDLFEDGALAAGQGLRGALDQRSPSEVAQLVRLAAGQHDRSPLHQLAGHSDGDLGVAVTGSNSRR